MDQASACEEAGSTGREAQTGCGESVAKAAHSVACDVPSLWAAHVGDGRGAAHGRRHSDANTSASAYDDGGADRYSGNNSDMYNYARYDESGAPDDRAEPDEA